MTLTEIDQKSKDQKKCHVTEAYLERYDWIRDDWHFV